MSYDLAIGYLLKANPTLLLGSIRLILVECLIDTVSDFSFSIFWSWHFISSFCNCSLNILAFSKNKCLTFLVLFDVWRFPSFPLTCSSLLLLNMSPLIFIPFMFSFLAFCFWISSPNIHCKWPSILGGFLLQFTIMTVYQCQTFYSLFLILKDLSLLSCMVILVCVSSLFSHALEFCIAFNSSFWF